MDKKALIKALRDTVQSASNTVAGGVSAPVDLIAAGLRKVGLPIPQAPVGGSQWMENIGLTVPVEDGIPKLAGETLGMIVPMAATAKAPQIAAAANRGLENLAAPRTLNTPGYGGQRGAIVWHGSPHKFEAFDASKIGTGEGAQAYGHGLYFAESPDVAGQYQRNLGGVEMRDKAGKVVPIPENVEWVAKDLAAAGGDYNKVRSQLAEHGKMYPWPAEVGTKYINELEAAGIKPADLGSLYKVDLPDEAIARMLDWDKPLSQQAQVVSALRPVSERVPGLSDALQEFELGSTTGQAVNNYISKALSPADAARLLKDAGIPGIRYLDEASRNKALLPRYDVVRKKDNATIMQVIEGNEKRPDIDKLMTSGEFELRGPFDKRTRNFVVFPGEERLLRILERNNQPMGLMGVK